MKPIGAQKRGTTQFVLAERLVINTSSQIQTPLESSNVATVTDYAGNTPSSAPLTSYLQPPQIWTHTARPLSEIAAPSTPLGHRV